MDAAGRGPARAGRARAAARGRGPSSMRSSSAARALKSSLRVSSSASVTSSSSASRLTASTIMRPRSASNAGGPRRRLLVGVAGPHAHGGAGAPQRVGDLERPVVPADDERDDALGSRDPEPARDRHRSQPVEHDGREDHHEHHGEDQLGARDAALLEREPERGRRGSGHDPARRHPGDEAALAQRQRGPPGRSATAAGRMTSAITATRTSASGVRPRPRPARPTLRSG